MESFVTVAPGDPDGGQDLTLSSRNLLDCLEKADGCVFVPETNVEELPLLLRSSVSR